MRRSRPMGIRVCSGIRLYEGKKGPFMTAKPAQRLGRDYAKILTAKQMKNPQTKNVHTFFLVT